MGFLLLGVSAGRIVKSSVLVYESAYWGYETMGNGKRTEGHGFPVRVLFVANECLANDFTGRVELAAWYEGVLARCCGDRVVVGVAYDETSDRVPPDGSVPKNPNVAYFPLRTPMGYEATGPEWDDARRALLGVIDEFSPDIIQCLGSEYPYGAIAEDTDVPVVIHMMGFLNIYYPTIDMANGYSHERAVSAPAKKGVLARLRRDDGGQADKVDDVRAKLERNAEFERRVMRANRYFFGRTEWDRNVVKFFSPGSEYFHVDEPLHYPFVREAGTWRYHQDGKLRLLTVSSADDRKGLGIILQTAKVLKELVGIDFEWVIAGHKEFFGQFERRCGINHEDVNVRLLGMIGQEDIVREIQKADLFVHPSIIDNSPRAICEPQIVGCPVISSNVGGVPQLVEDGVTGFLYPYNEPHTLAFLIANLMGQRDLLTAVSEASVRVARARNDSERIANRVVDVYEEIVASHEAQ